MPYFAPYIDSNGFHMPTYAEIRDQLMQDAKTIFGQDIYLEPDSQDYQSIAIIAEKYYDTCQLAQMVYNNRSPVTAIGSALDAIVKLNGIKRTPVSYSSCPVIVSGVSNSLITNGVIGDKNNINWSLPANVTIPASGSIEVLATCQIPGPISADPGDINKIVTPTLGWASVTNNVAATLGVYAETDAHLRAKQAVNTARPSRTLIEGTIGAISEVAGVTRYKVYENDTNEVDTNGIPAHNIACVVENGTDLAVATAIFLNKTPGVPTFGTSTVVVTDSYGQSNTINFFRPTYADIDAVINVKALNGYTSEITDLIKQNIVDYLNVLQIGKNPSISSLWGIALRSMPDLRNPMFSITSVTAAKHGDPQGTVDIPIGYNEVTRGNIANITVNVT